jgi:hypothetical protein
MVFPFNREMLKVNLYKNYQDGNSRGIRMVAVEGSGW